MNLTGLDSLSTSICETRIMENRESNNAERQEAENANISPSAKEQYEEASVQEREKMCGALEKGNEQEATDVEALRLLLDRQFENGLQVTDLDVVSSKLGRQLENRRPETDSNILSAQLEEQPVIAEQLQKENIDHNSGLKIEINELKKVIKELQQKIKYLEDSKNMEVDKEHGRRQEDAAENISQQGKKASDSEKFKRLEDGSGQQATDLDELPVEEQLETYKKRFENMTARLRKVTKENIKLQKELQIERDEVQTELQKRIEDITTRGKKVADYNIYLQSENDKLKLKIKRLQDMKIIEIDNQDGKGREQETNNMAESIPLGVDEESEIRPNQETGSTAENIPRKNVESQISKILPSLKRTMQPIHNKYRKQRRCPASCVPRALFFYLQAKWECHLCFFKFSKEMRKQQNNALLKLSKEVGNQVQDNDKQEKDLENCSSSLNVLERIDLIDDLEKPFFCPEHLLKSTAELDKALGEAVQKMLIEEVDIALIVVRYEQGTGLGQHCMVISRWQEKSNVFAVIYDAQNDRIWPQNDDPNVKSICFFRVYVIKEEAAKAFVEKCDLESCKEERRAATRTEQVTGLLEGIFHDCESDLDVFNNE